MGGSASLHVTRNFERNLESIRPFLDEAQAPETFGALLDLPFDRVFPLLAEYPSAGRAFFERSPASLEARQHRDRLRTRMEAARAELREHIAGDYLVLYAFQPSGVFLLAIQHHRQLSFDLGGIWTAG